MINSTARAHALSQVCLLLTCRPFAAQFIVLGPDHPIVAVMGEDVVLPCHLSPGLNAENMEVRWFRTQFSVYVHLYHSGQDHYSSQMPEYQGRTEILKEGISVGNASLRILRTRLSDEGQYHCLIKDGDFYEEATLELNVADPFFTKDSPWMAALFATLAVCLASLVIVILFVLRLRGEVRIEQEGIWATKTPLN
uniref:Ig-like domain-containing protein n=1 Tax=Buteo japonicus TaxID=224669 RepID=A0A8C0BC02_9AVES